MQLTSSRSNRILAAIILILITGSMTGCTATEEAEVLSDLQTAYTTLDQNRSLAEQFVRDVKSDLDPSDPAYQQVMQSYEQAKEAYNSYLDGVEGGDPNGSRSLRSHSSPRELKDTAADFLADATSALKPSVNTRRIPFQRAITIPDNLSRALKALPKKTRATVIDQFDDQVRWRSWSQM